MAVLFLSITKVNGKYVDAIFTTKKSSEKQKKCHLSGRKEKSPVISHSSNFRLGKLFREGVL